MSVVGSLWYGPKQYTSTEYPFTPVPGDATGTQFTLSTGAWVSAATDVTAPVLAVVVEPYNYTGAPLLFGSAALPADLLASSLAYAIVDRPAPATISVTVPPSGQTGTILGRVSNLPAGVSPSNLRVVRLALSSHT